MEGLGRINLLVGTNNCGKTSVLEAIYLAAVPGRTRALWEIAEPRSELIFSEDAWKADVRHLFTGRELKLDAAFSISLNRGESVDSLIVTFRKPTEAEEAKKGARGPLVLDVAWRTPGQTQYWPCRVDERGLLEEHGLLDQVDGTFRPYENSSLVRFLRKDALPSKDVSDLFGSVVLTPEEDMVVDALRSIEPSLERIASFAASNRTVVFAKLSNAKERIPIGSLGDGIWRMLGIALSLAKARGGILLIDEIDTGLHYSVMADMWRLVRDTAKRLDVQVFATTHSRDCYEALAEICRADVDTNSEVSIQRIEKGKPKAVSFSEREIIIVADRSIEVR